MKKRLCAMILLCLWALPCLGALASGASYIPRDCRADPCVCFIQRGDGGACVAGIIQRLILRGYLPQDTPTGLYTEAVEAAVRAFQADGGLPVTGTMDDDTLTLLIWGMLPEALDAARPCSLLDPETIPFTVFVPTDGGARRHRWSTCSGMINPRKVSVRNAEALGLAPCGICRPD